MSHDTVIEFIDQRKGHFQAPVSHHYGNQAKRSGNMARKKNGMCLVILSSWFMNRS